MESPGMRLGNSWDRLIPWFFPAIALALSFWLGIVALKQGSKSTYDPTPAVLTVILAAIIWYTYYILKNLKHAQTRDAVERRRARQSLASGLLAELRWFEEALEQVFVYGPFALQDALDHPLLQQAISQSTLFEPCAVGGLSLFYSLFHDVRSAINECRLNPNLISRERREQFKKFTHPQTT